jgi:hypothetical protein
LQPLLHSLDINIDTFSLRGVSSGGHQTLTKSVLSALTSHLLACVKPSKWLYQEIDKRRRAYFCSGQQSTMGGQCKVARDTVCRPIEEGGLNIKNLEIKNICMLLKFIYKLHTSSSSSWAKWIRSFVYREDKNLDDKIHSCSNSWRHLMTLIQLYRDLTVVKLGNDINTCFLVGQLIRKETPLSSVTYLIFPCSKS